MIVTNRNHSSAVADRGMCLALSFCLLSLTGCSAGFWKTAKADEVDAVEDAAAGDTEAVTDSGAPSEIAEDVSSSTDSESGEASSPPSGEHSESPDVVAEAEIDSRSDDRSVSVDRSVSAETLLEILRTSLSRTASFRKNRTKKGSEAFAKEAELQIERGLEAAVQVADDEDATLETRREAWKGQLTLLSRGEQLKLDGLAERLDQAIDEAAAQTEFQREAEYGSGLVLVNRLFNDGKLEVTLERLQQHASAFPLGDTSARLFLTYARKLGERGRFKAAILCCNIGLWQLNNHPDVGAVRNLLSNLQAGRTVDPSQDRIQQKLEKEVAELRSALPIRIDRVTTCTSISTSYHAIHYRFRVSASGSLVRKNQEKLKKSITNLAKTTLQTKQLLDQGVVLHYAYFDRDGEELLQFTVTK
ncbi:MAG: hypothetical protein ACYTGL_14630 [Planctomycetota bacterium]